MRHRLHPDLATLLSPDVLSGISGYPVTNVAVAERPVQHSASGNRFLNVTARGRQPVRYVVKRCNWDWDWLMQAFDDRRCREVRLWSSGLLDRLPPQLHHAVLAAADDGSGWAVLMADYSHCLDGNDLDAFALDASRNRAYLDALAALHARYHDDPALLDPALGLCPLKRYLTAMSPQVLSTVTDGELPALFRRAWDRFETCFSPAAVQTVKRLHADPSPLCEALRQYPQTLTHGDWAPRNLGLSAAAPPRTLAIDWQFATRGTGTLDLMRYLLEAGSIQPVPHAESIRYYRQRYEYHSGTALDQWDTQVALGCLGYVCLFGGIWAYLMEQRQRLDDLPWLERQIRTAAAGLS